MFRACCTAVDTKGRFDATDQTLNHIFSPWRGTKATHVQSRHLCIRTAPTCRIGFGRRGGGCAAPRAKASIRGSTGLRHNKNPRQQQLSVKTFPAPATSSTRDHTVGTCGMKSGTQPPPLHICVCRGDTWSQGPTYKVIPLAFVPVRTTAVFYAEELDFNLTTVPRPNRAAFLDTFMRVPVSRSYQG